MDQTTFNQYVEQVVLNNTSPKALAGHLGDVKMAVIRKADYDDRYVGEIPNDDQLRIDVVFGGVPEMRTVYNGMFPLSRYIENVTEIDIEILKQKLLQYKAELSLV